jgi:hypothetical protein
MQAAVELGVGRLSLSRTSVLVRPVTLRRIRLLPGPKPIEIAPTKRFFAA